MSLLQNTKKSTIYWQFEAKKRAKQNLLISVLKTIKLEEYLPYIGRVPGRSLEDRTAIAQAFVAKMVYNMATTRMLLDLWNPVRRFCEWERKEDVPSESTFSRAYAESRLPERVDQALIEQYLGEQIAGHISRDSTSLLEGWAICQFRPHWARQ